MKDASSLLRKFSLSGVAMSVMNGVNLLVVGLDTSATSGIWAVNATVQAMFATLASQIMVRIDCFILLVVESIVKV